jgi:tetratricopeptide (TPR) repeat protein
VTITTRGKENTMRHSSFRTFTIGLLVLLSVASGVLAQSPPAPESPAAPAGDRATRFDYLVRADFFAGMRGDRARFERAMKLCEETLAREPRHAEAMVWYGSGLLVLAGQSFRSGDATKGRELWERGLRTMAEAVAIAPDRVGVRIPRGATLLLAARQVPPGAESQALLQAGVGDYEKALALQTPYFERLSVHARGELLAGLAEGWHELGQEDRARAYLERMVAELDDTGYQTRAKAWLETGPPLGGFACASCHRSDGQRLSN